MRLLVLLWGCLLLLPALATAQAGGGGGAGKPKDPICPDSGQFTEGALATKLCVSCFFPIYVAGSPTSQGSDLGGSADSGGSTPGAGGTGGGGAAAGGTFGRRKPKPWDDRASTCTCPGRLFGYPTTGTTLGMSQPQQIVESVRAPYCTLLTGKKLTKKGGSQQESGSDDSLGVTDLGKFGLPGAETPQASNSGAYYNFHSWIYPVGELLNSMTDSVCVSDSGSSVSLGFITEIVPQWNNDSLATVLAPETVLFANPIAIAACMVDAVAVNVYRGIGPLFWCAGSWGMTYPFAGHTGAKGDGYRDGSLVAARGLALMHRLGIAMRNYGTAGVCRDHPDPILPKEQYRFQSVYPAHEKTDHWMGVSPQRWNPPATDPPGFGESYLFVVWAWQSCCNNP